MLKNFFLFLSTNRRLRNWMETSPSARVLSRRFIAGNHLEDGLAVVRELYSRRIWTALDPLGENVETAGEAAQAAANALAALNGAIAQNAEAVVSIKLTQFGLDLSGPMTLDNVLPLVRRAAEAGSRVEVDMESTAYTERTLDILEQMAAEGPVRGVIQAYLYRTADDIARLNRRKIPVRLCKGAYNEPASLAMPRKSDVDLNYKRMATLLLEQGTYPAFATHDPAMIDHILSLRPSRDAFEFQMLYGIRRDLQEKLVAEGWRLRLYVPFGDAWYPYFMRRLAERPANVWFVIRGLFL
ncbi:MAG TPA: proline dehydrogenase family protein [Bryobacteraceae bacterium]|nr:proline dehydrogenase family protein [Bryobacteraceae bacterium]